MDLAIFSQTESTVSQASSAAGFMGLAVAVISMIGTAIANYNARKVARDKMEMERQTALDKMQFDHKFTRLEDSQQRCLDDHKECKEETKQIRVELAACKEHHEAAAKKQDELVKRQDSSEFERKEILKKIETIEAKTSV